MKLPRAEDLLPQVLRLGEEYEFESFLIGVHLPESLTPPEKSRVTRPLKERLGRLLEQRYWPDRHVDFQKPHLQLYIDVARGTVEAVASPIYVAGRYRKLSRRISSSHWRHMACGGKGCRVCEYKGYFAEGSVGEIMGRPIQAACSGRQYFFHSMGREDVDARMLGTGRPFVVEVAQPRRRSLDLGALAKEINRQGAGHAEVAGRLYAVEEEAVQVVKGTDTEKSYWALVVTANPLPPDAQAHVASLGGLTVDQETPTRVRHRRPVRLRKRKVLASMCTVLDARTFLWQVRTTAGTYVKELASGDGGRTRPSLTEILGTPAVVVDLDVIAVHYDPPWEKAGS